MLEKDQIDSHYDSLACRVRPLRSQRFTTHA
jgi:hypothetical protein